MVTVLCTIHICFIRLVGLCWILDGFGIMLWVCGLLCAILPGYEYIFVFVFVIFIWTVIFTDFTDNGDICIPFVLDLIKFWIFSLFLFVSYTFGSIFDDEFIIYIFLPLYALIWLYTILYTSSD